jgi:hypothetical protein
MNRLRYAADTMQSGPVWRSVYRVQDSVTPGVTPKAFYNTAQGREQIERTLGKGSAKAFNPERVAHCRVIVEPLQGSGGVFVRVPRVRCATLGFVVQRRWR